MIVQRSWCLMCVNVMEMSDTISFSSKTWFYSPKCNKLKCAVDCCSQGNFCTVKVWWGSSCPLWVRMGSAGGGGMTCFTSVIAIAPCLRDYISNGDITSEFHFFSQAVGLCAASIFRLLESFCWENSKAHFRHQNIFNLGAEKDACHQRWICFYAACYWNFKLLPWKNQL